MVSVENFDAEKPVIAVGGYTLRDATVEAASIPEDSIRWRAYLKLYNIAGDLLERMNFESEEPSRILPQSNIASVLFFSTIYSFDGTQDPMQRLFSFAGYDIVLPSQQEQRTEAAAYVVEHDMPAYPKAGYIKDVGEYIIVHIQ